MRWRRCRRWLALLLPVVGPPMRAWIRSQALGSPSFAPAILRSVSMAVRLLGHFLVFSHPECRLTQCLVESLQFWRRGVCCLWYSLLVRHLVPCLVLHRPIGYCLKYVPKVVILACCLGPCLGCSLVYHLFMPVCNLVRSLVYSQVYSQV